MYNKKMTELVSIIVYTYHSSKTIIETLDSIKDQTYLNLELIVSDDASTDDTIDKVKYWMEKNQKRFVKCKVVVNPKNIGISRHFVKAIGYAHGKWIKTLAGDDTLMKDCIQNNLCYVRKHKDVEFLMSNMYLFDEKRRYELSSGSRAYCRFLCYRNAGQQYRLLLHEDVTISPSEFFRAEIFKKYGEPENPVRNIEDWPLRLHLTKSGCRLSYMDKPTVNYRQGMSSISRLEGSFFNPTHIKNVFAIERQLVHPNIKKYDLLFFFNEIVKYFRYYFIIKMGNKITPVTIVVNKLLLLFQPSSYKKIMWEIFGRLYDRRSICK